MAWVDVVARCRQIGVCAGVVVAACAAETDSHAAEGLARGTEEGSVLGTVSPEELARLAAPGPVPPPVELPLAAEIETLRDRYWRFLSDETNQVAAIVVRVDAVDTADRRVLEVTTLGGRSPGLRLIAPTGIECESPAIRGGSTLYAHISTSEGAPTTAEGRRILHAVLGGAVEGMFAAEALSDGRFEVMFPWGGEIVGADQLGGVP